MLRILRVLAWRFAILCAMALSCIAAAAMAQDAPGPANKKVDYSPYPKETFPNQVFFGDTHLHTSYSTDAGMVGCTLGPEDAYRFARGETVVSSTGVPARLNRPLDFLVVTDHSKNLGLAPAIAESNPELLKNAWGKTQHDLVKSGREGGIKAYDNWMATTAKREDPLKDMTALRQSMWQKETEAAEKYNEPGRFTALIGFEWTSMPNGNNLHRNVIFRDGKDKADQIVPFSQYDSVDAEDLWQWMAAYEQKTGGKVLAIPPNGNLSSGLMFDDVTFGSKKPLDRDYAERRQKWEPLFEITQMKGDSETHPLLSPNDEFANFERWDKASFGPTPHTDAMLPREYVWAAFKRDLAYEAQLGVNPFKFGVVGSTDAHTALSTTDESSYFGKVTPLEPTADPIRFEEVIAGRTTPAGKAPAFMVQALRDPDGANLDRLQIIKGWLDAAGKTYERIWDIAVSDGRQIDKEGRCQQPVGNTVNVAEATYTNAIGDAVLGGYWRDPAFDPAQKAFYYVRVLEIPTPRWTTYDAKFFGVKRPEDVPASIQERAYTSPIWYTP